MGFRNGADCSLRNERGPVRQKEREGKRGRKRERCHSYLPRSLSSSSSPLFLECRQIWAERPLSQRDWQSSDCLSIFLHGHALVVSSLVLLLLNRRNWLAAAEHLSLPFFLPSNEKSDIFLHGKRKKSSFGIIHLSFSLIAASSSIGFGKTSVDDE